MLPQGLSTLAPGLYKGIKSRNLQTSSSIPIYRKTLKRLFPILRKVLGWFSLYSIGHSRSTKFVKMMRLGWPLFFMILSDLCPSCCGNTWRILHGICKYAIAAFIRWANCGPLALAGSVIFFRGDWSWNIFYGHSLPSLIPEGQLSVTSEWMCTILPSKNVVR